MIDTHAGAATKAYTRQARGDEPQDQFIARAIIETAEELKTSGIDCTEVRARVHVRAGP
jgi:hypothetical protein